MKKLLIVLSAILLMTTNVFAGTIDVIKHSRPGGLNDRMNEEKMNEEKKQEYWEKGDEMK